MDRFVNFESDIAEVIQQTRHVVKLIRNILEEDTDANLLSHSKFNEVISMILERLDNYSKSIGRNYFKCVFVGRTSSGKSSTINALMKRPLLPVGMGHTTNCFVALKTTNNTEFYVEHISQKSSIPSAVYGIEDIKRLSNAVSKDKLSWKDHILIHVPSSNLPLLTSNVQVLDTPGLDIDVDFDEIIENYCIDADVFVLVCNAESVLMQCERKFLRKVRDKYTRPNVLILNNRWDISAEVPEKEAKEVKAQQMKIFSDFLAKDLHMCSEKEVPSKVFFVSMMEEIRLVSHKEEKITTHGRQERAKDYERFYSVMLSLFSNDAMRNKLKSHLLSFDDISEQINNLLNSLLELIRSEREILNMNLSPQSKYLVTIEKEIGKIHQQALNTIEKSVRKVKDTIMTDFKGIICSLDTEMGAMKLKFNPYDKKGFMEYQKVLVDRMEEQVNDSLEKSTITSINENLQNHFEKLTKTYKDLLLKHKPTSNRASSKFPVIKPNASPNNLMTAEALNQKLQNFSKLVKKVPRYFEDRQSCVRTLKSLEHRFTEPPKSRRVLDEVPTSLSKDEKLGVPQVILILPKFNSVMMHDFSYRPGFKFTMSPSAFREFCYRWMQNSHCPLSNRLRLIPFSAVIMLGSSCGMIYMVVTKDRRYLRLGMSSLMTLYFLFYGIEYYNWNEDMEMESLKYQFLTHSKSKMDSILIISASTTAKQLGSYLYMDLRGLHQGCEELIYGFRCQVENLQAIDSKLQSLERKIMNIISNDLYLVKQQIGVLQKSTDSI